MDFIPHLIGFSRRRSNRHGAGWLHDSSSHSGAGPISTTSRCALRLNFKLGSAKISRALAAVAIAQSAGAAGSEPLDCKADVDSCVRSLIAETAVFVEECGKAFPGAKKTLDLAFKNWGVLRLPIPRLSEALDQATPLRTGLSAQIAPYLQRIPGDEPVIECSGRLEMIQSIPFELRGDSAKLPAGALEKYSK